MKTRTLKKMCEKAEAEGREYFLIPEGKLLVSYCKYLVEYLEGRGIEEFKFQVSWPMEAK